MLKVWLLSVLILTPDGRMDLRHLIPLSPLRNNEEDCKTSGAAYIEHLKISTKLPHEAFRMSCQQVNVPVEKLGYGPSI